jgi:hypothetical protein
VRQEYLTEPTQGATRRAAVDDYDESLSSVLTPGFRIMVVFVLLFAVGLVISTSIFGPRELVGFAVFNLMVGLWMSRPYLFLRTVRLRDGVLLLGSDGDTVELSQVTDVGCTRWTRPHAVYLSAPTHSSRKIWFLACLRYTGVGVEHPVVSRLRGLAADARMKQKAGSP